MRKNGFTLIELLAVIVILAIIALIATPIILNIINDAKRESQERSVELYASAIKNGIAAYQLIEGKKVEDGRYTSETLPFDVEYDGDVKCTIIELYEDGEVYIEGCTVNKLRVEYTYGTKQVPFSTDDWSTIVTNIKAGNISKYNVGDTREILLNGFTNKEADSNGLYTIRIANTSTPSECSNTGFSQTACGFVIEFEDIITTHHMNPKGEYKGTQYDYGWNVDGYPASSMYTYIHNDIYNALPEELKTVIIPTYVVSGHGSTSGEENFVTEQDKLYLLSGKEVYGSDTYDTAANLTRQLEYYSNLGVTTSSYSGAIKKLNGTANYWWLRSASSYHTGDFRDVYIYGGLGSNGAIYAIGVAVAFRIG